MKDRKNERKQKLNDALSGIRSEYVRDAELTPATVFSGDRPRSAVTKWVIVAAATVALVAVMFTCFILNGVVRERWGQPGTTSQNPASSITETPGTTGTPNTTGAQITTESPITTTAPESTEVPETTGIPEGTTEPFTTESPITTETPETTTAPEGQKDPESGLTFTKAADGKSWIVSKIEAVNKAKEDDTYYSVIIPSEYEGLPVTELGTGAYKGDGTLLSVTLSEGITRIGAHAFSRGNVIRINIPGTVTCIEEDAFYFSGLKEITLSEGLKSIGSSAFFNCELTALRLPESLESIGNGAFLNNDKLTSICIPAGVTNIGEGAFGRFTEVQVAEGNPYYVNINGCIIDTRTHEVVAMNKNAVIPDDAGVTRITSAMGVGETLYVPASVEVIGNGAIGERDGESRLYSSVKKVIFAPGSHLKILEDSALEGGEFEELRLPDGLEVIGERAFRCCKIQKLIIPASVKSIGEETFSYQGKYVEIIYEGTVAEWKKLAANGISDYWAECGPVICTDGTTTITGE